MLSAIAVWCVEGADMQMHISTLMLLWRSLCCIATLDATHIGVWRYAKMEFMLREGHSQINFR